MTFFKSDEFLDIRLKNDKLTRLEVVGITVFVIVICLLLPNVFLQIATENSLEETTLFCLLFITPLFIILIDLDSSRWYAEVIKAFRYSQKHGRKQSDTVSKVLPEIHRLQDKYEERLEQNIVPSLLDIDSPEKLAEQINNQKSIYNRFNQRIETIANRFEVVVNQETHNRIAFQLQELDKLLDFVTRRHEANTKSSEFIDESVAQITNGNSATTIKDVPTPTHVGSVDSIGTTVNIGQDDKATFVVNTEHSSIIRNEIDKTSSRTRTSVKIDWDKVNRERQRVGKLGELLVMEYEREKLQQCGANKVPEHVSVTQGDSLGYDIISYTSKGKLMQIEVKASKQANPKVFYLSANELAVMRRYPTSYFIYHITDIDNQDKSFVINVYSAMAILKDKKRVPESYRVRMT